LVNPTGNAWKYGDNIDTDVIIPARYLTATGMRELADHTLEDLDPKFASGVSQGDIIVAGSNFGCGSSREHAPLAIKGSGVAAVVARSFARIFFRNAINTGLPILVCPDAVDAIEAGDLVAVDPMSGVVDNQSKGLSFQADPLPEFVMDIVTAGGLVPYVRAQLEGVA
jgi:3-isopropylmalate/(R)-2-methylmalate dehydratase small subunit